MKIDKKLARLIDALGPASQRNQQSAKVVQESADELNAQTVGAVRVASDFGLHGGKNVQESRAEKIARIKEQVEAQEYQPDPVRVAESVARDLL